jgi:hypothetical protein
VFLLSPRSHDYFRFEVGQGLKVDSAGRVRAPTPIIMMLCWGSTLKAQRAGTGAAQSKRLMLGIFLGCNKSSRGFTSSPLKKVSTFGCPLFGLRLLVMSTRLLMRRTLQQWQAAAVCCFHSVVDGGGTRQLHCAGGGVHSQTREAAGKPSKATCGKNETEVGFGKRS